MAYETCENCGSRVYKLGCTWCDEEEYIEEQAALTAREIAEAPEMPAVRRGGGVDREQLSETDG